MSGLREALRRLAEREDLGYELSRAASLELPDQAVGEGVIGAFLMGLRVKGETREEVWGCASALRDLATPVSLGGVGCVDICGTGGDHSGSLNLSTMAALVVAAAGVPVAKHGNRSVTSKCGSADLLEAWGVELATDAAAVGPLLAREHFAFLFAPVFHPATARVVPVRRSLGVPTLFNLLGPVSNPCRPVGQVVGVATPDRAETLAWTAARLGSRCTLAVCGADNTDELVTHADNLLVWAEGDSLHTERVDFADHGVPRSTPADISGGTPQENARVSEALLRGADNDSAAAWTVAVNAAALLRVCHRVLPWLGSLPADSAAVRADSWPAALEIARSVLQSGAAWQLVERLRARLPTPA